MVVKLSSGMCANSRYGAVDQESWNATSEPAVTANINSHCSSLPEICQYVDWKIKSWGKKKFYEKLAMVEIGLRWNLAHDNLLGQTKIKKPIYLLVFLNQGDPSWDSILCTMERVFELDFFSFIPFFLPFSGFLPFSFENSGLLYNTWLCSSTLEGVTHFIDLPAIHMACLRFHGATASTLSGGGLETVAV